MSKHPKLAFANISQLIKNYQGTHAPLRAGQADFLMAIDNRTRAIIATYHGWLKHGIVEDALHLGKKVTQGLIVDAYVAMQKKIIGFLCVTVGTLLHDVRAEKERASTWWDLTYNKLLTEIEGNITSVLDNISKNILLKDFVDYSSVTDIIDKIKFYDDTLSRQTSLARLLHGRMLPFSQSLDPLRSRKLRNGVFDGSCYGHVKSWCNDISRHGYCEKFHCLDTEVMDYQEHQKLTLLHASWVCDIYAKTDLKQVLASMLSSVKADRTYILHLMSYSGHGHVIGIRLIQASHDVEFFDPNFGTFVFDKQENFCKYLADLLCGEYYDLFVHKNIVGGELRLHESGVQPLDAKPCLPSFGQTQKYETRYAKNAYRALSSSLYEVAYQNRSYLIDISYTERHQQDMLSSAALGTIFASMAVFISNSLIVELDAVPILTIYASVIAAGVVIENKSRVISSVLGGLRGYLRFDHDESVSDRRMSKMRFDKKHPWVNNMSRDSEVDNNVFLFNTRNRSSPDLRDEKRVVESDLDDRRPLKKHR